jgi:hypothetical protein
MRMTPSAIPSFSFCYIAPRGEAIDIRAMRPTDEKALLDFLCRIPLDDRQCLRDDITSSDLVSRWATHMNYDRALPLLAFVDALEIPDHVAFYNGRPHHVTLLTIDLQDASPTPLDEPAHYVY